MCVCVFSFLIFLFVCLCVCVRVRAFSFFFFGGGGSVALGFWSWVRGVSGLRHMAGEIMDPPYPGTLDKAPNHHRKPKRGHNLGTLNPKP